MRAAVGLLGGVRQLPAVIVGLAPYVYYRCDEAAGAIPDSSGNGRGSWTVPGSGITRQVTLRGALKGLTVTAASLTGGAIPSTASTLGYSHAALINVSTKPTSSSPFRARMVYFNNDWVGTQSGSGSSSPNAGKWASWHATSGSDYRNIVTAGDQNGQTRLAVSTWDKTTFRFYIDGTQIGTNSVSTIAAAPGSLSSIAENGGVFTIGHFAYWERALSAGEVTMLYNALLAA